MSCDHCPRKGTPCLGQLGPRLCRLVDPAHPAYDPRYLAALEPPAEGPAAYPPLAAQARGLAGSLATWLRAGCPITPAAERARRREVCAGAEGRPPCPDFDAAARRCRVCGCFGAAKPWLGTATCPRGRWDRPSQETS